MITEPTSPPSGLASPSCCLSSFLDRVILGDNCETLAAMPAESVDLVVTSPPYDDLRTYGGHSWDFPRLADELTRVLKPGGVIVWVAGDKTSSGCETLATMRQAIHFCDCCGLDVWDTMIWHKTCPSPGDGKYRYHDAMEYMVVISKGQPKTRNLIKDIPARDAGITHVKTTDRRRDQSNVRKDRKAWVQPAMGCRTNVWSITNGANDCDPVARDHPAIFPEKLAKDHVATWSNPGDVVLDCFAGSGTTLKAAKELGRRFVGVEINPEYVAICHKRLAQEVLNLFPDNSQAHPPEGSV